MSFPHIKKKRSDITALFLLIKLILILLLILSFTLLVSCGDNKGTNGALTKPDGVGGKVKVVASIFPLYEFAKEVGGDEASVVLLLPPGLSPHSFEPTPKDIKTIGDADIFIFNGAGMEPWVDNILSGINSSDLIVVDSGVGVNSLMVIKNHHEHEGEKNDNHDNDEEDKHDHSGGVDPHYWLDFNNAKIQMKNILEAYVKIDPENAALYKERAGLYMERLTALDSLYRNKLSACDVNDIISSGHFAFGYTARRYGFNHYSVFDLSHDAEPSPKGLAEMISTIKEKKIDYIFAEELMDPKLAMTLKEETGAEILVINPAGNVSLETLDSGTTFIDIMEDNLTKFKLGLKCK